MNTGYAYLAKALRLGMLLKTESREMDPVTEHPGLGQDTHAADTIKLHFHIGIAVGVSKIRQMRPVCGVLGVALDNDSVLVERLGELQGRVGLLPRVEIVWLLSTEPVR